MKTLIIVTGISLLTLASVITLMIYAAWPAWAVFVTCGLVGGVFGYYLGKFMKP